MKSTQGPLESVLKLGLLPFRQALSKITKATVTFSRHLISIHFLSLLFPLG